MLTPFGLRLRNARAARRLSLRELATALNCTSAYISSIESGKRAITDQMFNAIMRVINPTTTELKELKEARDQTVSKISIDLETASNPARETVLAFARRFTSLSDEELKRIHDILYKRDCQ